VDTGDSPHRAGCDTCMLANRHLLSALATDLRGDPIALLWITHQHSDHIGGAPEILGRFHVRTFADNGRGDREREVKRAHEAAVAASAEIRVIDPDHRDAPIAGDADVTITPVLPRVWPPSCAHDPNECTIALRIDYCASSVLFTGDAEHEEEKLLEPLRPITLLQVAHHGSETSSTPGFLAKIRPAYAVISAGKPGEGLNRDYCHPRAIIVKRLTHLLGNPGAVALRAFDGERCAKSQASDWIDIPGSTRMWATARDGDVVLTTTGDGTFSRN